MPLRLTLAAVQLSLRSNKIDSDGAKAIGFTSYLILWEGFPPEVATWEPENAIHDDFVDAYEAALEAEAELEAEEAAEDAAEDAAAEEEAATGAE